MVGPERGGRRSRAHRLHPEPAAVALLGAANVTLSRLSRTAVVPAALGTAAAMAWLARRAGATWSDLGMEPAAASSGAAWGLGVALPAVASVGIVAATGAGHVLLLDRQAVTATRADVAYHLLVRIPFATALPEEVVFRGALPAIFARRRSRRRADALSAALFGLWHVPDALEQLRTHPHRGRIRSAVARSAAAIGGSVVVTAAAGLAFSALRDRARSMLAPAIVHAATNAAGLVAGAALARRTSEAG